MTVIPITCDNCGAKYKLPPTFKGSQAKCQKCGSVIDVAKQRESASDSPAAAAKPASARPAAAAKPAVDRSKSKAGTRSSSRGAAAAEDKPERVARGSSRSRRGAKDDDDGDEAAPRRGERKKPNNQMQLIVGAISLLAIVVVVVVFFMMGVDKSKQKAADEQAKNNPPANQTDDQKKPEEANKPAETDPAAGKPGEAAKPTDAAGSKPDAGTAKPATPKPTTPPPAADTGDPNRKKERWEKQKNPPQSMDQVRSAKERYGEVQWPASISDKKRSEIRAIVADLVVDGGLPTIRAKRKLAKEGYASLFGIAERLRELDYKTIGDAGLGFELNKIIEEITAGLNAGYAPVGANEMIHPAKAEWNTQTVNAWMKTFAKWPDAAAFKKNKRERAKKNG